MFYTEAIKLAKAGEEKGFTLLYEETYKSKYYFALQYMKNEEAAQDVLQEAYLKAFSKLDTLGNPEAFSRWLGMIVANTAKNALVKKNPMLFSDIAVDDENEEFEYQIEDDSIEYQPETAYTRQETQQLVHELMDKLSEEQRVCILMFHIEGISIKEIASVLDCSENTVKSRLKYGRDNLKMQAEELQKKGYKLYSVAPIPLLLYMLREEFSYLSAGGTFSAVGNHIAKQLFPSSATPSDTGASAGVQKSVESGIKATKSGFIHTVAGKITVVVAGLCIVGGAVFYGVSQMNSNNQTPETKVIEEQDEVEQTPAVKEMQDEDYETLIAGNLSKEELQFLLAYGPSEIPEQGFQDTDYLNILNSLCTASKENLDEPIIGEYEHDADWRGQYSLRDVNRMFLAFTDYQLKEGDTTLGGHDIRVSGDVIAFYGASLSSTSEAVITSAEYTEEEMDIYFTHGYISVDMAMEGTPKEEVKKKAVLKPDEKGMYRIVKIEKVEEVQIGEEGSVTNGQTMEEIYAKVRKAVANKESGYDFSSIESLTGQYGYFLYDIDKDGIEELIVGAEFTDRNETMIGRACRAYSCEKSGGGYTLKNISGEIYVETLLIMTDGSGLYHQDFSRGSGIIRIYEIMIQNGELITAGEPEYQFTMGDDDNTAFGNMSESPQWIDITN